MCSCILIITQTFSNFSVFPVVLLFALKVCVPRDGSHKCNFQNFISSPSYSPHPDLFLSHLWLYFISSTFQPLKSCMGFSVLLLLDMKLKEQASFRRFNPDQKDSLILYSSSLPWQKKTKSMPQEDLMASFVSGEISVQVWPSFMPGPAQFDLEFVFWKWNCCWCILLKRQSTILYYHWYWSYPDVSTCVSQSN